MAALSALAALAALTASGVSIANSMKKPDVMTPPTPTLPDAPDSTTLAGASEAALSRRKAVIPGGTPTGRASTLLTGASGLTTDAAVQRKTLLGS